MQAKDLHSSTPTCVWAWKESARRAVESASELQALGLHKQIVNRVLEPFQMMKTIVTSTEWDNFFELRMHKDAQPEIQQLARKIHNAIQSCEPMELRMGEWHVPYVSRYRCPEYGSLDYHLNDEDQTDLTLDQARKVSASCCAQVSYRVLDDTLEKAEMIYDRLVNAKPIHASPFEHQATILNSALAKSGNFTGWLQNREILET
jgi:thymidylate synthase ThyX